jgi:hypothetical protein
MSASALSLFKKSHGVATHRKAGAGHRYPWVAYFERITMKDGTVRWFSDLANEFSWDALERRNKWADDETELSACKLLAECNRIPWPADEPKKRKAKP